MTATNEILEFAGSATAILSQAQYQANVQLENGLSGYTDNLIMNKILKQATLIAASVAQFIADNQVDDVVDTLPVNTIVTMLTNAIVFAVTNSSAFGSFQDQIGYTKLGNGTIEAWGTAVIAASETIVSFPTPFPNNCFNVTANDNTSSAHGVGTYSWDKDKFKAIAKDGSGTAQATTIVWRAVGN